MNKKFTIILFFSLCFLAQSNVFAQRHSADIGNNRDTCSFDDFYNKIIIKINPFLFFIEDGGMVQYNFPHTPMSIAVGGGYNPAFVTTGTGYTARSKFFYFFNNHNYAALEFMFRRWSINNVFYFRQFGYTDSAYIGQQDYIIAGPLQLGINEMQYPDQLGDAVAYVYCADILYGFQHNIFHSNHFLFEFYTGLGLRIKQIYWELRGNYVKQGYYDRGIYAPVSNPQYSLLDTANYLDLKLGFSLGFKL